MVLKVKKSDSDPEKCIVKRTSFPITIGLKNGHDGYRLVINRIILILFFFGGGGGR